MSRRRSKGGCGRRRPRLPFALGLGLSLALTSAPAAAQDDDAPDGAAQTEDGVGADDGTPPAQAAATTEADADKGDEPSAADLAAGLVVQGEGAAAFHLNASLTNFVGQGVFASGYGRSGTVLSQLAVAPSLSVGSWVFYASQAMQFEYTDPDNATGRRYTFFDTTLGAQRPLRFESISSRLVLSGGVRLPVSHLSRAQGSIGGLFTGATGIWSTPLDGLQVALSARGQLNSSVESLRATGEGDEGPSEGQQAASCLLRSGESGAACSAIPNVANLSGTLQVAYTYERLTTSVSFGVLAFMRPSTPDDELTPDNANAGAAGTVFSSGNIQLTYALTRNWLVNAGLSSFQPIQTANGQGMRFPFWNFSGVANGFSSVTLGATFIL